MPPIETVRTSFPTSEMALSIDLVPAVPMMSFVFVLLTWNQYGTVQHHSTCKVNSRSSCKHSTNTEIIRAVCTRCFGFLDAGHSHANDCILAK